MNNSYLKIAIVAYTFWMGFSFYIKCFKGRSINFAWWFSQSIKLFVLVYVLKLSFVSEWFNLAFQADKVATLKIGIYEGLFVVHATKVYHDLDISWLFDIWESLVRYLANLRRNFLRAIILIQLIKLRKEKYKFIYCLLTVRNTNFVPYKTLEHEARHALAFHDSRDWFYRVVVFESGAGRVEWSIYSPSRSIMFSQNQERMICLVGSLGEDTGGEDDQKKWEEIVRTLLKGGVIQPEDFSSELNYFYRNPQNEFEVDNNNKVLNSIYKHDLRVARKFVEDNEEIITELAQLLKIKRILYQCDLQSFWDEVVVD